MPDTRATAARLLAKLLNHQGSLSTLLPEYTASTKADDIGRLKEYCYGVMRWYFLLNSELEQLLDKPLRKKDRDIHALLLIGCYQIRYMRTPSYAAVTETVNASRILKKKWAAGLVNGVLRSFERQQQELFDLLEDHEKQAFPLWLAQRIQAAWPDQQQDIMQASNERPPMTLRVNRQKISRDNFINSLSTHDVLTEVGTITSTAVYLTEAMDVQAITGFSDGLVSVQDEGAQLAAEILACEDGQRVLDACSAPGGKTAHILERYNNIDMTAVDNSATRLERVKDNLQRLNLQAKMVVGDMREPGVWHDNTPYDRILLDVPCSATGVVRRNPDIKFLRREDDLAPLQATQAKILHKAWSLLKPGGHLVYATCSILPEENEQIVASFLASQDDASHDPIIADWGLDRSVGRQLLPGKHDGFYYARLIKNA